MEPRSMSARLFIALILAGTPAWAGEAAKPKEKEKFTWSDLLPRSFQKNPRLDVMLRTELFEAGKKVPPPTVDHPTYYFLLDGGLVEEGDPVAGDKPPPPAGLAE